MKFILPVPRQVLIGLVAWAVLFATPPAAPLFARPPVAAAAYYQASDPEANRADEWKRREILETLHGRSDRKTASGAYLEIIIVPLLLLILVLGIVRLKDF